MPNPAAAGPPTLLLGADVGATHSRVRVVTAQAPGAAEEPVSAGPAGTVAPDRAVGAAEGPGFNRNSSGPAALAGLVATADRALQQARTARPGAAQARVIGVLGIAGAGPAHHAEVQETVRDALTAGLDPTPDRHDLLVVDDQVTAFAAGSTGGDGLLLLAGTGAAAVRYRDFEVAARGDGMGWLLGDTGSAVWIGREVLQAAAADLDGRGPATALTAAVLSRLGLEAATSASGDLRQDLIAAVHRLTPAQWGDLAPSAQDCADDDVAGRILQQAARELIAKVDAVREDGPSAAGGAGPATEIVLTGSVLSRNPVISDEVRRALGDRGLRIVPEAAPLDGAVRLARWTHTSISISPSARDTHVIN